MLEGWDKILLKVRSIASSGVQKLFCTISGSWDDNNSLLPSVVAVVVNNPVISKQVTNIVPSSGYQAVLSQWILSNRTVHHVGLSPTLSENSKYTLPSHSSQSSPGWADYENSTVRKLYEIFLSLFQANHHRARAYLETQHNSSIRKLDQNYIKNQITIQTLPILFPCSQCPLTLGVVKNTMSNLNQQTAFSYYIRSY